MIEDILSSARGGNGDFEILLDLILPYIFVKGAGPEIDLVL